MLTVRGHNEGSLFYRKRDGRWVAKVSAKDGSRPSASCRCEPGTIGHRSEDVRRKRPCAQSKALLAEMLRLQSVGARPSDQAVTLGTYLTGWLASVKPHLAPATYRKHESLVRTVIRPALGDRRLSELSVGDVRALSVAAVGKRGPLGPRSRGHARATLRRALADALRDGLVTRNVAALAEPPRMPQVERPILTSAQARLVIAETRDDRMHALYVLALTTGMREAELLGLPWQNVDLEEQCVTVDRTLQRVNGQWEPREPKTLRSRRTIPLTDVAVAALRARKTRQQQDRAAAGKLGKLGLVFTTSRGAPIHGTNLLPAWYAHLERLGLPRVTIHDARHTAATIMFERGVPLAVIADILGHSTIRVTADLYRHRVPALSVDAARRMQEAVG